MGNLLVLLGNCKVFFCGGNRSGGEMFYADIDGNVHWLG